MQRGPVVDSLSTGPLLQGESMAILKELQALDLEFAAYENGAKIVISGQKYDCVATGHEESEASDDLEGVMVSYTVNVTMPKAQYRGPQLRPGHDTVMIERDGRTRKYRVQSYGESASGHAILLTLQSLRT